MYLNFLPLVALGLLVVWILLALEIRRKKTNLFHDQVEPKLAESRLKMLKAFLLVAGIFFALFIVGVVLHNVLSALFEIEEPVSFFIAIVGLFGFVAAALAGLILFLTGRRKKQVHI